jgi:hypothetical protein
VLVFPYPGGSINIGSDTSEKRQNVPLLTGTSCLFHQQAGVTNTPHLFHSADVVWYDVVCSWCSLVAGFVLRGPE